MRSYIWQQTVIGNYSGWIPALARDLLAKGDVSLIEIRGIDSYSIVMTQNASIICRFRIYAENCS